MRYFGNYSFIILVVMLFMIPSCTLNIKAESDIYIRLSQVGFLPADIKTAVVLSSSNLSGAEFTIKSSANGKPEYSGKISSDASEFGNFKYCYIIDFSSFRKTGDFYMEINGSNSYSFLIDTNSFDGIAAKLLEFFKVQRCGYTNPLLHGICHISDAKEMINGGRKIFKSFDVTGGWHDAGDYVKFLNTTAFATYMLLFSYEFDPVKFGFDNNKDGIPDILEEAKIGLDWMLRARYGKDKLVTQVQDLRDHDVGWRMPEDDPLGFDRPAYLGMGKNLIGIYSAVMALASRIWKDKIAYPEYAQTCLNAAEELYSIRNRVPDVDSSGSGMYVDRNYEGKMALGAAELYITTRRGELLNEAAVYADSAGSDYWWSWGDINTLAHYKLARFIPRFGDYIRNGLNEFNKNLNKNIFGTPINYLWGTNNTLLGISLQAVLYKKLYGNGTYDSLMAFQRDYMLGRNPWGISFVSDVGKNYTRNFHHQISYLKGKLPGGFAAGPASKKFLEQYNIQYSISDPYSRFQTEDGIYRDDRMDFITNEPTITANATAIFVFGNLSK